MTSLNKTAGLVRSEEFQRAGERMASRALDIIRDTVREFPGRWILTLS